MYEKRKKKKKRKKREGKKGGREYFLSEKVIFSPQGRKQIKDEVTSSHEHPQEGGRRERARKEPIWNQGPKPFTVYWLEIFVLTYA